MAVPEGCVTVAEACRRLGMSRKTFDRLDKDGTLARLGLRETNRLHWRRFFEADSLKDVLWRRRVGGRRVA